MPFISSSLLLFFHPANSVIFCLERTLQSFFECLFCIYFFFFFHYPLEAFPEFFSPRIPGSPAFVYGFPITGSISTFLKLKIFFFLQFSFSCWVVVTERRSALGVFFPLNTSFLSNFQNLPYWMEAFSLVLPFSFFWSPLPFGFMFSFPRA